MCNSHMYGDWIPVFSVYTNPFHSCVCFITYNKALYLSSTEVFIISQSNNTKSQQLVMVYLLYHANNSLNQWRRPDQPQRKEGQKERKKEKEKKKKEKREGSGNIKAWVTLRFKNKNKTQLEHVYVYCSGEEWITFLTEWSYALTLTLTSSTGTNWLFLSSFHGVKNQALSQPPDRVAMNFAHSHTLFKGL